MGSKPVKVGKCVFRVATQMRGYDMWTRWECNCGEHGRWYPPMHPHPHQTWLAGYLRHLWTAHRRRQQDKKKRR